MRQPSAFGGPESKPWQKVAKASVWLLREIGQECLKRRRMRRRRLHVYSTDPRRPQGHAPAGIDRIKPARPPCGLIRLGTAKLFSASSTCPADLFGPVSNGTITHTAASRVSFCGILVSLRRYVCTEHHPQRPQQCSGLQACYGLDRYKHTGDNTQRLRPPLKTQSNAHAVGATHKTKGASIYAAWPSPGPSDRASRS